MLVRHALPGGGATDVLGELSGWADGRLQITSRTGVVVVAEADVLAVKAIPAAPVRRPPR